MRWITLYCVFLAGITVAASASDEKRSKRSLNHILNFVTSKLFGGKSNYYTNALKVSSAKPILVSENKKYKILRLPGFNKVLVKAVPKIPIIEGNEIDVVLEKDAPTFAFDAKEPTSNANHKVDGKTPAPNVNQIEPLILGPYLGIDTPATLTAIQDVDNLIDSGILNASHDVPYIQYIITSNTHNVHVDGSINVGTQATSDLVDVIKPIQIPPELIPLPLPSQPQSLPAPDIIEIHNVVPNVPQPVIIEEIYQNEPKPTIIDIPVPPTLPPMQPDPKPVIEEIIDDVKPVVIDYQVEPVLPLTTNLLEPEIIEEIHEIQPITFEIPPPPVLPPMPEITKPTVEDEKYHDNSQSVTFNMPLLPVLSALPPLPPIDTPIGIYNSIPHVLPQKPAAKPTIINIPSPPALPPWQKLSNITATSVKSTISQRPRPLVVEEIDVKPIIFDISPPPSLVPVQNVPVVVKTEHENSFNRENFKIRAPPKLQPIQNLPTHEIVEEIYQDNEKPVIVDIQRPILPTHNVYETVVIEENYNKIPAPPVLPPFYSQQRPGYFEEIYQENFKPMPSSLQPNAIESVYVKKQPTNIKPTVIDIPEPPMLSPIPNLPRPIVVEEIYQGNGKPIAAGVSAPSIAIMKAPFAISGTQYPRNPNLYNYGLIHNDGTVTTYHESGIDESLINNRHESIKLTRPQVDNIGGIAITTLAATEGTALHPLYSLQKPGHFETTYEDDTKPIIAKISMTPILRPNLMESVYVENQPINLKPTVLDIPDPPELSSMPNLLKPVNVEEIYQDNAEFSAPPITIMKAPFDIDGTQYQPNSNLYNYGLIHNDGTVTTYHESGIDESLIDNRYQSIKLPQLHGNKIEGSAATAEMALNPLYSLQKPGHFETIYEENTIPIIAEIPMTPILRPIIAPTVMDIPEPPMLLPIPNLPKPVVLEEIYQDNVKPIAAEILTPPIAVSRTQYLHNPNLYNYGLIHNDGTVTTFEESGIDDSMNDNRYQSIRLPQEVLVIPQNYSNKIGSGLRYKSTMDKTTASNDINFINSPKFSYRLVYTNGTATTFEKSGINEAQKLETHGLKLMYKETLRAPHMQNQKAKTTTVVNTPLPDYSLVRNRAHLISPYEVESAKNSNSYSYDLIHNDGTKTTFLESGPSENRDETIKLLAPKNIKLLQQPPDFIVGRLEKVTDIAEHAERYKATSEKTENNPNNLDYVVTKKNSSNPYTYRFIQNDGSMVNYIESGNSEKEVGLNVLNPLSRNAEIPQGLSDRLYNTNNDASYMKHTDFANQHQRLQSVSGPYSYGLIHNDGTVTNYVESGTDEKVVDSIMKNTHALPAPPSYIMNRLEEVVAIAENCHDLNTKSDDFAKEDDVQIVVHQEPIVSTYVYKQMNHNNPSPYTVVNLNGQSNTLENIDINTLKTNKGNNRGDIPDTVL